MKTLFSLFLVTFTFLGILDASYISYEKLTGSIPPCNIHFQCETVLTSKWSSIGPVPLSILGLLFYSTFFVLAILFYTGKTQLKILNKEIPLEIILLLIGTFGAGFSLYLVFIMGMVLRAWCLYCLFSAANCAMLFLISSILYFIKNERQYAVHI